MHGGDGCGEVHEGDSRGELLGKCDCFTQVVMPVGCSWDQPRLAGGEYRQIAREIADNLAQHTRELLQYIWLHRFSGDGESAQKKQQE